MANLNVQDLIDKEVERRVEEQLELRKAEVTAAAKNSLDKIKEISNENNTTELKIALQLKRLEDTRREFETITQEKEKYLNKCAETLEHRNEAIQRAIADSSEEKIVTFNMGGTVFTTLKSTLSNMSPFFANLFSDKWRDANLTSIKDKDGNILIPKNKRDFKQNQSLKVFDVMILKLKRLLGKVPLGKSKIASYAAALWLIREYDETKSEEQVLSEDVNYLKYVHELRNERFMKFRQFIEDAPTNATGAAVVGTGDTGVSWMTKKKQRKLVRRQSVS